MAEQSPKRSEEERVRLGQSVARGNTGDGRTGVRGGEQGISNHPGDAESSPAADDEPTEADDDGLDDDDLEDDGAEDDEITDPEAEPGKPI